MSLRQLARTASWGFVRGRGTALKFINVLSHIAHIGVHGFSDQGTILDKATNLGRDPIPGLGWTVDVPLFKIGLPFRRAAATAVDLNFNS